MNFSKFSIVKINNTVPEQQIRANTYGICLGYDLDQSNYRVKILKSLNNNNNQTNPDGRIVNISNSMISEDHPNNEYSILYNKVLDIYSRLNTYIKRIFSELDERFYDKINPQVCIILNEKPIRVVTEANIWNNTNNPIVLPLEDSANDTQVQKSDSLKLEITTINYNGSISIFIENQDSGEDYENRKDFTEYLLKVLIVRFQAYLEYRIDKSNGACIFSMFPPEYSARDAIRHLLIQQHLDFNHLLDDNGWFSYCDPFEICSRISTLLLSSHAKLITYTDMCYNDIILN